MSRLRSLAVLGGLACTLAAASAGPALAQGSGSCLTSEPPPVDRPAHGLRFGITPGIAGSAGALQEQAPAVDENATVAALEGLRPPRRELVVRLNRMFWADGDEAIRRFADSVDRYARQGFQSEVQVRYHPPEGAEGDIDAWESWVRRAVGELGKREAVVGFSITNEANLPVSPNTSDGAYEGVVDALVRGVSVAREELDALGRGRLDLGFNVMWRWSPDSDARFWREVGAKATPQFRAALTNVGLQVYPGLVWPPTPLPNRTTTREIVEALTLVRRCYMPMAGLGDDVQLWVSENGYATNGGRSEGDQVRHLDATVRGVHRWSGTLGVTDYRWFNLRDNNSDGTDLFSAVGLLRDDYSPKPAYAAFRGLSGLFGREAPAGAAAGPRGPPVLTARAAPRSDRRGPRRFTTTGRVTAPTGVPPADACSGLVSVRYRAGRTTISNRLARVRRRDCGFRSRVTFREPARFRGRRRLRVVVRFHGNRSLRPARARGYSVRVR